MREYARRRRICALAVNMRASRHLAANMRICRVCGYAGDTRACIGEYAVCLRACFFYLFACINLKRPSWTPSARMRMRICEYARVCCVCVCVCYVCCVRMCANMRHYAPACTHAFVRVHVCVSDCQHAHAALPGNLCAHMPTWRFPANMRRLRECDRHADVARACCMRRRTCTVLVTSEPASKKEEEKKVDSTRTSPVVTHPSTTRA